MPTDAFSLRQHPHYERLFFSAKFRNIEVCAQESDAVGPADDALRRGKVEGSDIFYYPATTKEPSVFHPLEVNEEYLNLRLSSNEEMIEVKIPMVETGKVELSSKEGEVQNDFALGSKGG